MKKLLIGIALIGLLLAVGCMPQPEVRDNTLGVTPSDEGQFTAGIVYTDDAGMPYLEEGFGIKGSDVTFDGVYAGYSATIPVTLVNGQDKDRQFWLSVRIPSKVTDGYEPIPFECLDWIVILEPSANLLAGDIYQVPVSLVIPKDVDYEGKQYEARVLVENTNQTGLVQIAVSMKWYIIVR